VSGAKASEAPIFAENVTEVNDRSLSRLEVIQKSKLRSPRFVPFRSAADLVARAKHQPRVSPASVQVVIRLCRCTSRECAWHCVLWTSIDDILSSRGETGPTFFYTERECVELHESDVSTHLQYVSSRVILVGPTEGS